MNRLAGELLLSARLSSRKRFLLSLIPLQRQVVQRSVTAFLQNPSSLRHHYSKPATTSSIEEEEGKESSSFEKHKPQQQQRLSKTRRRYMLAEMLENQAQVSHGEAPIESRWLPKEKEEASSWPRPSEIPFQTRVANSVNLIGDVEIPVQFKTSADGKYWAGTIISQSDPDSSDSPPFWIPVIFEGDMAHVAACHLKKKDRVYIAGQLSADPPPFTMNEGQANVQVMVRSIDFVKGSPQMKKGIMSDNLKKLPANSAASPKDDISVNQSWKDLFASPHEWWDIRSNKGNSMAASFENKHSGQLLWVNESIPEWIQKKLECLTLDHKVVRRNLENGSDIKGDRDPALSSWNDLLRNPQKWRDNREYKLRGRCKPKYPDFKHKDTGLALWLDSAPKWVLSNLDGLKFDVKQAKDTKGDDFWKNLVDNPDRWWDNRMNKVNVKAPDFKHKDTGKGLWLSNSPDWVLDRLPPLRAKNAA
ncbi:protein OSB2, chloroplastic-like isoform X2 [Diospyros lotus]|uniref:protein OSB2, chloroplastic-like isoform X2 n=1 Tax=Diospyros lotus TaxID=55363 RepID=UPI00225B9317|nr:protein OSB2, chloroplastic-like isoform X2 [Diospyros lotus]